MTLYAGAAAEARRLHGPGISDARPHARLAIVRNRTGYCFGLEFLTPLGSGGSQGIGAVVQNCGKRRPAHGLRRKGS